jgi:hypothetical protein
MSAQENLHSLNLSLAIPHCITEPIHAFQKENERQQKEQDTFVLLIAKLESQSSSPRVTDFDVDAFDMAADNCATKTCTPYVSDLCDMALACLWRTSFGVLSFCSIYENWLISWGGGFTYRDPQTSLPTLLQDLLTKLPTRGWGSPSLA